MTKMVEQRRGYRIRGVVQGVGFRWWTAREALRLGVRGFVRNLPDGSVEVVAEGGPEPLQRLEEILARGPRGARVVSVERGEAPGGRLPDPFEIR